MKVSRGEVYSASPIALPCLRCFLLLLRLNAPAVVLRLCLFGPSVLDSCVTLCPADSAYRHIPLLHESLFCPIYFIGSSAKNFRNILSQ
jgi:hypothetical protein